MKGGWGGGGSCAAMRELSPSSGTWDVLYQTNYRTSDIYSAGCIILIVSGALHQSPEEGRKTPSQKLRARTANWTVCLRRLGCGGRTANSYNLPRNERNFSCRV